MHRFNRWSIRQLQLVPEVSMAIAEPLVTGLTNTWAPVKPMLYAESRQRLQTTSSSWRAIYMPHPGHLKFAGVQEDPIHIEEHLQAIQVQSDHIFSL